MPSSGVVLFGRVNAGSTSDSLRTVDSSTGRLHDIPLETSFYALVMVPLLPEVGQAIVFNTYTSPSYARSVKRPSTVDDQLFIVRRWSSGSTDIEEFALESLEPVLGTAALHYGKAVLGDTAYRYTYPTYDNFVGWRGQLEFIREPLGEGQPTRTTVRDVRSYLSDPYFPFALLSVGENLYGVVKPTEKEPSIVILRVDPSTGEPTEDVTFTVRGFGDYARGSWEWVVDNGFVYWVATRDEGSDSLAEIWWHELEAPRQLQSASFSLPPGATGIVAFDVDDEYMVLDLLWTDRDRSDLILFELNTQRMDIVNIGLALRDVQIIQLGE